MARSSPSIAKLGSIAVEWHINPPAAVKDLQSYPLRTRHGLERFPTNFRGASPT
jgi:hypothetical protein